MSRNTGTQIPEVSGGAAAQGRGNGGHPSWIPTPSTWTGGCRKDWKTAWCCTGSCGALGYDGGYSILKAYVSPRRRRMQPEATMRFETGPGEQAQVDWGACRTSARTGSNAASGCS